MQELLLSKGNEQYVRKWCNMSAGRWQGYLAGAGLEQRNVVPSQASCQYLMLMLRRPVINVQTVNPKLFAVVQGPIQKNVFWFEFMA